MSKYPTFPSILRWSDEQGASIEQGQKLVGVEGPCSNYEEALASVLMLSGRKTLWRAI